MSFTMRGLPIPPRPHRRGDDSAYGFADLLLGVLEAKTAYAIIATDPDGVIAYFNHGAEALLGYRADEVVGIGRPDMFHDPEELASRAAARGVPIDRAVFTLSFLDDARQNEWTFVDRDGERFPVELTVNEMRSADGVLRGYSGVALDISDRLRQGERASADAAEQEALRTVAALVASNTHPRAVFAAAAEHAARVLAAITSSVFRLEPDGKARLVGYWARADMPPVALGALLDAVGPTAAAFVLRTGSSMATMYETGHPGLGSGPMLAIASGASAPIEVDGQLWGAVGVGFADAAAFNPTGVGRLQQFASLVSLAVTGAEAREQLASIASTDHLTGLPNQRSFSDRLDQEVRRARRYERALSLVLIDLDHLKLVNDTHGHEGGDRALAELALRLSEICGVGEVLARVGGEEFAWILPETDAAGAMDAAERARVAIAATPFAGIGRLTVSAGACTLSDAETSRELVRQAELALYWAKSNGRNTIFQYSHETLALLPPDEQTRRLEAATTLAAVRALATAVDAKDSSTQRHSERVAALASALAAGLGWDATRIALLHDAALVHDVGKIGIPDRVLLKPGALTPEEYEQIKPHAALGAGMVGGLLSAEQVSWIRHHHERCDGTGYPDGLAGEAIPDGARILATADMWDAMTVARPYGAPRMPAEALDEAKRSAGVHLCPDVVAALVVLYEAGSLDAPERTLVLHES
jgi:diguanylate cyclase (GGDEF)-like protein/PAS domain S-box-containing protein